MTTDTDARACTSDITSLDTDTRSALCHRAIKRAKGAHRTPHMCRQPRPFHSKACALVPIQYIQYRGSKFRGKLWTWPVGPRCPFQRLMSLPAPHPHPLEAPFPGEIWTASPPGKALAACGWCTVAAGGVAWFRPRTKFFTSKSFFSPSSSPSLAPSFCDCRRLVVLLHFLPLVIRPSILRYSFYSNYYFLPFFIPSNYSLSGHPVALNFDHHLFKTFLARCRGTFPNFRVRKKIDFLLQGV